MTRAMGPSPKAAFTLIEIMVVLLIMSMLLGLGIGAFSKVGSGPALAVGHIKNVVRTARFHAVREQAPSAVRVDPEINAVVGLGWKNVGCWHFEDSVENSSTGFPVDAVINATPLAPKGVIGQCLNMSMSNASMGVDLFVPAVPSLSSLDGVAVDCFIRLNAYGSRPIVTKGGSYALMVTEDGRLKVALTLDKGKEKEAEERGLEISLESSDYSLPLHRWVQVGFQFNGYSLYLTAEGILRNREHFKKRMRMVPHNQAVLQIASKEGLFDGLMDELRLSAVVLGDETPFHESIQLTGKAFTIHFNTKGFLDKDFHTQPQDINFLHGPADSRTVTVGLMGEVK